MYGTEYPICNHTEHVYLFANIQNTPTPLAGEAARTPNPKPVQNMPTPLAGEAALYTSMTDCFTKTIAKEGVGALYQVCVSGNSYGVANALAGEPGA